MAVLTLNQVKLSKAIIAPGLGNVALGYGAVVQKGGLNADFINTVEIGHGVAVSNGFFHYQGYPYLDGMGGVYGNGSHLSGITAAQVGAASITDSRLSDARIPLAHTQDASTITGLGGAARSNADAFATAAQGVLAGTAVQPAALGAYALTNSIGRIGMILNWVIVTDAGGADPNAIGLYSISGPWPHYGTNVSNNSGWHYDYNDATIESPNLQCEYYDTIGFSHDIPATWGCNGTNGWPFGGSQIHIEYTATTNWIGNPLGATIMVAPVIQQPTGITVSDIAGAVAINNPTYTNAVVLAGSALQPNVAAASYYPLTANPSNYISGLMNCSDIPMGVYTNQ